MFLPLLENIEADIGKVRGFIVLCDSGDMPETPLDSVYCYEDLLASANEQFDWPEIDENDACGLCYTSGTTGNPKGVLYSHRSIVLQAMNTALALEISCRDVVLPIVPMFHVNGWTLPFVAAVLGIKLVLPGKDLDGGIQDQLALLAHGPIAFVQSIQGRANIRRMRRHSQQDTRGEWTHARRSTSSFTCCGSTVIARCPMPITSILLAN